MKTLIVITGPTGSGKTSLAIKLAQKLDCEIISADSRQIYRGIPITTAAPSAEQLSAVPHHLIDCLPLESYYSAALFETDVMTLLPSLWRKSDQAIMCGGSMMYIDAVTNGIDELPTISPEIRARCLRIFNDGGTEAIRNELNSLDPAYLATAPDLANHRRMIHALEICLQSGKPYSSMLTGRKASRDFNIVKFAINLPREEMFRRINNRVDAMVEAGMEQEAESVYHLRHLNSLNTVGFKEWFAHFDGLMDRTTAIERIKKNTRVYAKKQLTWIARTPEQYIPVAPDATPDRIIATITELTGI